MRLRELSSAVLVAFAFVSPVSVAVAQSVDDQEALDVPDPVQDAEVDKAADESSTNSRVASNDFSARESMYSLRYEPSRPRGYFWWPFLSFLVPGADQAYENQFGAAASYFGLGVGGIMYAAANSPAVEQDADGEIIEKERTEAEEFNDAQRVQPRKVALGLQTYMAAGGFSAYHSFRSSVRSRRQQGDFLFLKEEETASDLMLAPFKMNFLSRPSTFIPLGIAGVLAYVSLNVETEKYERDGLSSADTFFAGAQSYYAGTWEEAAFRGWVMPVMMHWTQSEFWSSFGTAGIFAAAHANTVSVPVAQFLLGWHLGNVSQNNRWTLSESIFIHTWWDIIVFLAAYQVHQIEDDEVKARTEMPVLNLPPLQYNF